MKEIEAVDGNKTVNLIFDGDISVQANSNLTRGSIDGHSTVSLESTNGSITIASKIDGQSTVHLKAAGNIFIYGKIDGQCTVRAESARGVVRVSDKIDGQSTVRLEAWTRLTPLPGVNWTLRIDGKIDGQSYVRLVGIAISIEDLSGGPAHGRTATTVKYSQHEPNVPLSIVHQGTVNPPAVFVKVPINDPFPFG